MSSSVDNAEGQLAVFRIQQKHRYSWMPWLFHSRKPRHETWAQEWQDEVQRQLMQIETVTLGRGCFIAPEAHIFAEPGRPIHLDDGCSVAAEVFLHGPIHAGKRVSFNARVSLDGGAAGIQIGDDTRIATGTTIYAFNHGIASERSVCDQPVRSQGIRIGCDVWIGAQVGITDGVTIGDHAVVAMGAVVTHDVRPWQVVAGVPARPIGDRRDKKYQ